jgi:arsenate reductase (glutaredoxin)
MDVVIYHNPACGTSRNTLALIRHVGIEPRVVEYQKTPLSRADLLDLIARIDVGVRDVVRQKEAIWTELRLGDPDVTDDRLLDALVAHPILLNRPIVVSPLGAALCRPSERVLHLLPEDGLKPFTKEDGEVVVDAEGRRVR